MHLLVQGVYLRPLGVHNQNRKPKHREIEGEYEGVGVRGKITKQAVVAQPYVLERDLTTIVHCHVVAYHAPRG